MILTVFLAFIIFTITFISLFYYIRKDVFQPIVWILALYFLVGIIIRGFQLILEPYQFQSFTLSPIPFNLSGLNWTLFNVMTAEICILFGYYIGLNIKKGFFYFILPNSSLINYPHINEKKFEITLKSIIILFLLVWFYIGLHRVVFAFGIRTYHSYSFLLTEIGQLLLFAFLLFYSFKINKAKKVSLWFYIVFFTYFCFNLAVGGKKGSILLFLQLFIVYYYVRLFRRVSTKRILLALAKIIILFLVLLAFVIYPFVNSYRNAAVNYVLKGQKINYEKVIENMSDFTSLNAFIDTLLNRFQYIDESYLVLNESQSKMQAYRKAVPSIPEILLYSLIPRFIWTEKPNLTTGLEVTKIFCGLNLFTATAIGFIGSAYAEGGGFVGVVVWSFVVGFIFGILYKILTGNLSKWVFIAIYASLYRKMCLIVEGNIGTHLVGLFYNFVIFYILSLILIGLSMKLRKQSLHPEIRSEAVD